MATTKQTEGAKSIKMDMSDLEKMIKAAVAEAMTGGEEKSEDVAEEAAGMPGNCNVMDVIEEAVEAAAEKRKARKEAGEEVSEEITPEEIMAEAAAILDGIAAGSAEKADDEAAEEKADDGKTDCKTKSTMQQTKTRKPAVLQRKYSDIYIPRSPDKRIERKKIAPEVQLARAVKCLDVFGRHDPDRAAYYAKTKYGDDDMAREFKAMAVTLPSAGGYLVPEIYLDEIIEMLYAKTVIFELGARKVPMPNGNLNIPKMTSGTRATWGGEQRKIAKTQPTFGNIRLSAKRLEAIVPQTRELLMSTDYSADAMFANDLTRRMELGIDYGGMFGTGGEFQPLGIARNKEVETVDATALNNTALASATGQLTADFPVWLVSKVMAKNVDDSRLGWTFNSFVEGYLKNMKTEIGEYIYREEMNQGKLLGFPYKVSNQIETANDKTTIIFGNWSDLLVGEQLGLETYTTLEGSWTDELGVTHNAFEENLMATRALMYVDVAVRHAESFIVVKNVSIV